MTPQPLKWGRYRLDLGRRTLIMGVLNITPDSFSDGGEFFDPSAAVAQAEKMVAEGADIIDIGGESTRPFSDPVSEKEELRRVIPVIEAIAPKMSIPISIDTQKAAVAKTALNAGASIINDISALNNDPAMGPLAAKTGVPLILMHMKGAPKTMQKAPRYEDLMGEISCFFTKQPLKKPWMQAWTANGSSLIQGSVLVKHSRITLRSLNRIKPIEADGFSAVGGRLP